MLDCRVDLGGFCVMSIYASVVRYKAGLILNRQQVERTFCIKSAAMGKHYHNLTRLDS